MLTLLIIHWLYRKYGITKVRVNIEKLKAHIITLSRTSFTSLFLFFSFCLHSQEQARAYKVFYKGDVVGTMQFYRKQTGDKIFLKMTSDIQISYFILKVHVVTKGETVYENGKLLYSHEYRNINGNTKTNKETRATESAYLTTAEGRTGSLDYKVIDYNFLLLYCKEPVNIQKVYSDNFQQFLAIKKTDDHKYRVDLPDGNYNCYTYRGGVCTNVEIHHSFYTVQMQLQ